MASVVQICNYALRMLGAQSITAIDEGTKNADLCNELYPDTRDAVLRDHPWNCAIVRQQLNQDSTGPIYQWQYSYTLPTDPYCLRVLGTSLDHYYGRPEVPQLDEWGRALYPYVIEGRKLLSDSAVMSIQYISRVEDVNLFDPLLKNAVEKAMARELAFPITRSMEVVRAMDAMYQEAIIKAKGVDAQENDYDVLEADILWQFRF